jgi:hypothetical protein
VPVVLEVNLGQVGGRRPLVEPPVYISLRKALPLPTFPTSLTERVATANTTTLSPHHHHQSQVYKHHCHV